MKVKTSKEETRRDYVHSIPSLNLKILKIAYIGMFSIWSSCVSDTSIRINSASNEDDAYSEAYDQATKKAEIYKNFEAKFRLTTTYLSPVFRAAFSTRLEGLFTDSHPSLDETGDKAGFFVSIQSPDDKKAALSDTHLWTIFLESEGKRFDPIVVKRLDEKRRWRPFFPDISKWSREYIILFDTPSITTNDPQMVQKRSLVLNFANADARVSQSW